MFNTSQFKFIPLLIGVAIFLCASLAQAVNNRPATFVKGKEAQQALETITKKKAEKRAMASRELAKELTLLEQDWGIKMHGIRWTAGGYMLEMKFRVLDAEKAFPLLKRQAKRHLVVEKSGAVLEVPFTQKLGSLKSTVRTANMVKEDHNYIALFANPGKHVNPGDKVTLVIGNFMAEGMEVM